MFGSARSSMFPVRVARTTPRAGFSGALCPDWAARAGRWRRPRRQTAAAAARAPAAPSSSQRAGTAARMAPAMPSPMICVPEPVRLKTERPSTYRSSCSTSGSRPETAAENTGATEAATATMVSMAAMGSPGNTPMTSPGTALISRPEPMTRRGGSRSARELNSAPPTAWGANPRLNASAVRKDEWVCANTSTDRPRISNWKPNTYIANAANSTRNSATAKTAR